MCNLSANPRVQTDFLEVSLFISVFYVIYQILHDSPKCHFLVLWPSNWNFNYPILWASFCNCLTSVARPEEEKEKEEVEEIEERFSETFLRLNRRPSHSKFVKLPSHSLPELELKTSLVALNRYRYV